MAQSPLLYLSPALLAGCWGRNIGYEGGETAEPVETVECGADVDTQNGFRIEGFAFDLETGAGATEGLCITAIDPTPALTGGEPVDLAASTICPGGTGEFVIAGIEDPPDVGIFLIVDDCDGQPDTVQTTGTGIAGADYAGLGDGDVLNFDALSVSGAYQDKIDADLAAVGYAAETSGAGEDGYLAGYIEDASGAPVGGAVVECGECVPAVYYFDSTPDDGLFGSGSTPNTSTDVDANAMFLIPNAPVFNYTAADGGAHTWDPELSGSLDNYGVFVRFTAQ